MIVIDTIAHCDQRYETVGDWFKAMNPDLALAFPSSFTRIRVSNMGNEDYEFLVALHELIEWYMCKKVGVTEHDVDEFDKHYEENRQEGDYSEPGDHPDAPYHSAHRIATAVEMLMSSFIGVDWNEYNSTVEAL